MIGAVIGLDTSNYRTSVAVVSLDGRILMNRRELLPVARGNTGLRQSDAVYAHLKQVKPMMDELRSVCGHFQVKAVCASTTPRDRQDSYMPVFEVGDTMGRGIAAAMGVPFFQTDHQHGHIRSAQYGTELEGMREFLAFHLSGGTTDLLHVQGERIMELGTSLDLHAGQMMDRVGVSLGCDFPSGPEMERMAAHGQAAGLLGCAMAEGDLSCHLSGAETQAQSWIREKKLTAEDLAREVFDLLARTVSRMLAAGSRKTGIRDALVCGGIASSGLFREMLAERIHRNGSKLRIVFGSSELSGDNAVGAALIGADRIRETFSDPGPRE